MRNHCAPGKERRGTGALWWERRAAGERRDARGKRRAGYGRGERRRLSLILREEEGFVNTKKGEETISCRESPSAREKRREGESGRAKTGLKG